MRPRRGTPPRLAGARERRPAAARHPRAQDRVPRRALDLCGGRRRRHRDCARRGHWHRGRIRLRQDRYGPVGAGGSSRAHRVASSVARSCTTARTWPKRASAVWQEVRGGRIAYVFQDPQTTLNPLIPVGDQVAETIRRHQGVNRAEAMRRTVALFESVSIPSAAEKARAYPHEMSGGQRQRVGIAMALANDPELIIADEPTTALDVTTQAQVLKLLNDLRSDRGAALMFISHDFGVVAALCDRVHVMYAGRVVESGPVRTVLQRPRHPYTQRLLACVPELGSRDRRVAPIPGLPPSTDALPPGCAFAPRCHLAIAACSVGEIGPRSGRTGASRTPAFAWTRHEPGRTQRRRCGPRVPTRPDGVVQAAADGLPGRGRGVADGVTGPDARHRGGVRLRQVHPGADDGGPPRADRRNADRRWRVHSSAGATRPPGPVQARPDGVPRSARVAQSAQDRARDPVGPARSAQRRDGHSGPRPGRRPHGPGEPQARLRGSLPP